MLSCLGIVQSSQGIQTTFGHLAVLLIEMVQAQISHESSFSSNCGHNMQMQVGVDQASRGKPGA